VIAINIIEYWLKSPLSLAKIDSESGIDLTERGAPRTDRTESAFIKDREHSVSVLPHFPMEVVKSIRLLGQGIQWSKSVLLKWGLELRPLFNVILPSFALFVGLSMGHCWMNTSKERTAVHRFVFRLCVLLELCGSPGLGLSFLIGLGLGVVGRELGSNVNNPQLDL